MPEHYVVIDGLELPARLSGNPALDFCNTLAGWDEAPAFDYLESYDHLATWAGFVRLLGAERVDALRRAADRRPRAASDALEAARTTRGTIYAGVRGWTEATALDPLTAELREAIGRLALRRRGDEVEWEIAPDAGLDAPRLAALWAAGQLLASPERMWIRTCPGHDCGWLFIDRSGRRRWCTMATCGNRAKAKRFADRRRTRPGGE